MALTPLTTIKNWFKTNLIPTQQQFYDMFDSFRHKSDKVAATDVDGLTTLLSAKASNEAFNSHTAAENAHAGLFGAIRTWVSEQITGVVVDSTNLGSLTPLSTIPATINVHGFATEAGTYANCGDVVVPVNAFAFIARVGGVWGISKTGFDLSGYAKTIDLTSKANLVIGKNKFNKTDSTILLDQYLADYNGMPTVYGSGFVTHYIAIKAGETLICSEADISPNTAQVLYDANKTIVSIVLNTNKLTATADGFVRFSVKADKNITINTTQVEIGTVNTVYEIYGSKLKDSELPTNIVKIADLAIYTKLVIGKNKFNKADSTVLLGQYLVDWSGSPAVYGDGFVTHYIEIKAGQTLFCNNSDVSPSVAQVLYNVNKTIVSIVLNTNKLTANVDGYVRFSVKADKNITINTTQVEIGTVATTFENYGFQIPTEQVSSAISRVTKTTVKTVKRYGTSGVDADFCGLNAIGDALASITDATGENRYKILVNGIFVFTNPTDFVYKFIPFDEPTILVSKDFVDIEGYGVDRTIIAVELATNSVFPSGKGHMDYQPVMLTTTSKISNLSVIAKNCRYAIHLDYVSKNSFSEVENCYLIHKGNSTINGNIPDGTVLGTGVGDNSKWIFDNCEIISVEDTALAVHSSTDATAKEGAEFYLNDCKIDGIIAPNYLANDLPIHLKFSNCKYSNRTILNYGSSTWSTPIKYADFSFIKVTAEQEMAFNNTNLKGKGLRIKSKTTGLSSMISFDVNATAFNSIMGDSTEIVEINKYSFKKQYGYFYKAGGAGVSAVSISNLDIDEVGVNSLGKRLGNCSVTNKTLTVIVNGITYNIVFNENFTTQNNAYVIAKITAVIGTVSDVDTYSVGKEYYPLFDSVQEMKNVDVAAIKSGMGVVFLSQNTMRIALNSDNKVDAICIDDTAPNTYGRTQRGKIYSSNSGQRFSTLEVNTDASTYGDEFGISTTQAGYFDRNANPKILRCYAEWNSLKFIK